MSPLETEIQELEALTRKGYSVEQIQCASLMLISQYLRVVADSALVMTTPMMVAKPAEEDDGQLSDSERSSETEEASSADD